VEPSAAYWCFIFEFKSVAECRLQAYPVLYAKQGDYVVQFKFTVLILPSGPTRITGVTCDLDGVQSEKTVNAEVNVILAQSTKVRRNLPWTVRCTEEEEKAPQEAECEPSVW